MSTVRLCPWIPLSYTHCIWQHNINVNIHNCVDNQLYIDVMSFSISSCRILGFRRAPLVVGRFMNLRTEIKPVATDQLLSTFLMHGQCHPVILLLCVLCLFLLYHILSSSVPNLKPLLTFPVQKRRFLFGKLFCSPYLLGPWYFSST